jgi:biotin operon repressor
LEEEIKMDHRDTDPAFTMQISIDNQCFVELSDFELLCHSISHRLSLNQRYLSITHEAINEINNVCEEITATIEKTLFTSSISEIYDIINSAKISLNNISKATNIARENIKKAVEELKLCYKDLEIIKGFVKKSDYMNQIILQRKLEINDAKDLSQNAYYCVQFALKARIQAQNDIFYLSNCYSPF